MTGATIIAPGIAAPSQAYASFWRRAGALAIDMLIAAGLAAAFVGIILGILTLTIGSNDSDRGQQEQISRQERTSGDSPFEGAIFWPPLFLYDYVATALGGGFGKRLLGLRVVRADNGEAPGWSNALVRALLRTLFIGFFFIGIFAVLRMLRDPLKQTLYDEASGTVVIRINSR